MAVQQEWTCTLYDILSHGVTLGFDHNTQVRMFQREGVHGEDGAGYTIVYHSSYEESLSNPDAVKIVDSFLEKYKLKQIKVLDD